jgi:hypothetical protein
LYDVPRPIKHRGTVVADLKVSAHPFAQFGRNFTVKIIGNFPPDFDATDFNGAHSNLPFLPGPDFPVILPRAPATIDAWR